MQPTKSPEQRNQELESLRRPERESEEHEHHLAFDFSTSLQIHDGETLEKADENHH